MVQLATSIDMGSCSYGSVPEQSAGKMVPRPAPFSRKSKALLAIGLLAVSLGLVLVVSQPFLHNDSDAEPTSLDQIGLLRAQLKVSQNRLAQLSGKAAEEEAEHMVKLKMKLKEKLANNHKQELVSPAPPPVSSVAQPSPPSKSSQSQAASSSSSSSQASGSSSSAVSSAPQQQQGQSSSTDSSSSSSGSEQGDADAVSQQDVQRLMSRAKLQKAIFEQERKSFEHLKSSGLAMRNQGMKEQLQGRKQEAKGNALLKRAKDKLVAARAARRMFRRYNLQSQEQEARLLQRKLQRESQTLAQRAHRMAQKAKSIHLDLTQLGTN